MNEFEGKTAIVTGGASGIGRATALLLAEKGANVVVADINEQDGRIVADQIGPDRALFIKTDVTKQDEVQRLVSVAVARFGSLDYAVNAAGMVGPVVPLVEYSTATWEKIVNVNLTSVFLCLKAEIAQMQSQGTGGAIVNVSSALGLVGLGNVAGYTATKHAVAGLTKDVALEVGKYGIRVNGVAPGSTRTPMYVEFSGGTEEVEKALIASNHPIGRIAEPEDLARAIVALLSDAFGFTIGTVLPVDGGWTIQ
jgi:NAD(P)-dependent dehydrogenase (short-subunit alcohol dehydrogenase family)